MLIAARMEGADLVLDLSGGRVVCREPRGHRLVLGEEGCAPELFDDHPLLWPYRDSRGQLFFRGAPRDAAALVGRLWEAHDALARGFLRLEDSLAVARPRLLRLLAEGYGLLADGPQTLLREYARVLAAEGIEASFSAARPPLYRGLPEDLPLRLWSCGASWVVAPRFDGPGLGEAP